MRVRHSAYNIASSVAGQFVMILLNFLSRIIFVRALDIEYLGIHGLFTNILAVLSVVELGVGQAIIYSLYKPLAENDRPKVKALVKLYASIYRIIGAVVFLLGLVLMFSLNFIMKERPDIPNLELLFLLFLINAVITYLFAHKRSILIADQKTYVINIVHYSFYAGITVLQIFILLVTENYLLFLTAQVLLNVVNNMVIARLSDRRYPYLKKEKAARLADESKTEMKKNIFAMMFHRMGDVIVFGTDNLIISAFLGVATVGLYSNYTLITTALNGLLGQVFSATTASVGNLNTETSTEKKMAVFKSMLLIDFWLYSFSSIALLLLLNPFIELWLGADFLLDFAVILFITANFYLSGIRKAVLTFRDAMGLFWYDRYKPLLESLLNIVVSIWLLHYFGLIGVLAGTMISTVATSLWIEPYVLYKYGFSRQLRTYFCLWGIYLSIGLAAGGAAYFLASLIEADGTAGFAAKAAVSFIVPNVLYFLLFRRLPEFRYIQDAGRTLLKRKTA